MDHFIGMRNKFTIKYCDRVVKTIFYIFLFSTIVDNFFDSKYKNTTTQPQSTRQKNQLWLPRYNNNYGKRLRKYSVPYIFNTIENLDLAKLETMDKLKTTIKRWILLGQINEPTTVN